MDQADYRQRCTAVAETFVAAFPGYVTGKLESLVGENAELSRSIDEACAGLAAALESWAATPAHRQDASPLELFREALTVPTAAALALAVDLPDRSAAEVDALPGDRLAIAPMTSRDLGDEAWNAHVEWGLARAEFVAGMIPRSAPAAPGAQAALVGSNLMDRSRIEPVASDAGYELVLWRNPAAVAAGLAAAPPALALVDLEHPAAMDAIRGLAESGVRTVAFGPHVDDHALAAARSLGATDVMPRSRFFRNLAGLFPVAI